MNAYVIYLAGGVLATSFMANNKILRGLSWVLTSVLIATLYMVS